METLARIGLVAIGSAVGGVLRWGVGIGAGRLGGAAFPYGTLFINVVGSLILGWLYTRLDNWTSPWQWLNAENARLLVGVGFCGGFTTFSSFEWESYVLVRDSFSLLATIYIAGSVALGFFALWVGVAIGRM